MKKMYANEFGQSCKVMIEHLLKNKKSFSNLIIN